MIRYMYAIAILAVMLSACGSSVLETAYRHDSVEELDRYFQAWHASMPPITDSELSSLDEAEKAIYAVYEQAFSPFDHALFSDGARPTQRYFIVQGSVPYKIIDPASGAVVRSGVLQGFRPPVPSATSIVVYLTDKREVDITGFLDKDPKSRSQFLARYAYVLPGHWGKGWHLATPPVITDIQFDRDYQSGRIWFRKGYEGGQASLIRKNGVWVLYDPEMLWTE